MFHTKDINIWRPDSFPPCWRMFWCLTSIYSQTSPVYGSEKCLTAIYGNCMSIYGSQTKNKIKSSNVNIFWLEHFYTIRYNTFFHTFLCSTTYQKLTCWSFLCRNPFKNTFFYITIFQLTPLSSMKKTMYRVHFYREFWTKKMFPRDNIINWKCAFFWIENRNVKEIIKNNLIYIHWVDLHWRVKR